MEYVRFCGWLVSRHIYDLENKEIGEGCQRYGFEEFLTIRTYDSPRQYAFAHVCPFTLRKEFICPRIRCHRTHNGEVALMTIENQLSMNRIHIVLLNEEFIQLENFTNYYPISLKKKMMIPYNKYWIKYRTSGLILNCKLCGNHYEYIDEYNYNKLCFF